MSRALLNTLLNAGNTVANYQGGVGFTGTTNCSAWANQIGAAGALIQATAANQPAINGDELTFDGTNDTMTATLSVSQPCTIYLVVRQINWTLYRRFFDSTSNLQLNQEPTNPSILMNAGSSGPSSTGVPLNTYKVIRAIYNGATSSLKINHDNPTTGNPNANGTGGSFTLGSIKTANGQFSNIGVKEIIVRNIADSYATSNSIIDYLGVIHGIDVGAEPNNMALTQQQRKRRRG